MTTEERIDLLEETMRVLAALARDLTLKPSDYMVLEQFLTRTEKREAVDPNAWMIGGRRWKPGRRNYESNHEIQECG